MSSTLTLGQDLCYIALNVKYKRVPSVDKKRDGGKTTNFINTHKKNKNMRCNGKLTRRNVTIPQSHSSNIGSDADI